MLWGVEREARSESQQRAYSCAWECLCESVSW
uniref:Uncharacterized protein n=1 Tax=Anguilla anguilla TaxID=7936 RepID=A0A0E9W4R3_ANGAN